MQYWNGLSWVNMIGGINWKGYTPPVITLIGESVIEIQMGSTFEDPEQQPTTIEMEISALI